VFLFRRRVACPQVPRAYEALRPCWGGLGWPDENLHFHERWLPAAFVAHPFPPSEGGVRGGALRRPSSWRRCATESSRKRNVNSREKPLFSSPQGWGGGSFAGGRCAPRPACSVQRSNLDFSSPLRSVALAELMWRRLLSCQSKPGIRANVRSLLLTAVDLRPKGERRARSSATDSMPEKNHVTTT
jgi:hypothetical protein